MKKTTQNFDDNTKKKGLIYFKTKGRGDPFFGFLQIFNKIKTSTQRSDVKFVDVYNNYTDAQTGKLQNIKN